RRSQFRHNGRRELPVAFHFVYRRFRFVAYYKRQPSFPHLFHRLIGSPSLRRVADEIEGKSEVRIYKQDWTPRCACEHGLLTGESGSVRRTFTSKKIGSVVFGDPVCNGILCSLYSRPNSHEAGPPVV